MSLSGLIVRTVSIPSARWTTPEPWRFFIDLGYDLLGKDSPVAAAFETWATLARREGEEGW